MGTDHRAEIERARDLHALACGDMVFAGFVGAVALAVAVVSLELALLVIAITFLVLVLPGIRASRRADALLERAMAAAMAEGLDLDELALREAA